MLVLQIMFGVVYTIALLVTACGAFGLGTLLPPPDADPSWPVRIVRWLACLLAFSLLLGILIAMRWFPFHSTSGCSRSHPCYQVQTPVMPTPTITLKADLPGTPTAEDCNRHVAEFKAKNSFSTSTVVVGECS